MCLTSSCKEYRPTPSLLQVTQNPGIFSRLHIHYKMYTHTFSNVIYSHLMIRRSLNHAYSNESIMLEKFSVTLLCLFEPDVVYDPDVIACLVKLLSRLLNCKVQENHPDVYIASAVRNPQTYDCFKKELGRFHINILFHYTIDLKHINYS